MKGLGHTYTCIHSPPTPPLIQAGTEHWAEFPLLYHRSVLVIHFKYSSVYMTGWCISKATWQSRWGSRLSASVCVCMSTQPSPCVSFFSFFHFCLLTYKMGIIKGLLQRLIVKIICIHRCGILGTVPSTWFVLNKCYQLTLFSKCFLLAGAIGGGMRNKKWLKQRFCFRGTFHLIVETLTE